MRIRFRPPFSRLHLCPVCLRCKTPREKKQQAAFYQLKLRAVKKSRAKQIQDLKVGIGADGPGA